jgi:hypothetical protein
MSEAAPNPNEAWRCGQCGEPIIGEPQSGDPTQRKPCPKCGSTSRAVALSALMTTSSWVRAQATVATYPQRLLTIARRLIDDEGQFSFAVVVAHTACEIATERSLDNAFLAQGIQSNLQDWVKSLNYGYNLGNNRIRRLYTAVTGHELQKQGFWQKFKASVDRRNSIVHKGVMVEKADAEESYEAARELLAHLKM